VGLGGVGSSDVSVFITVVGLGVVGGDLDVGWLDGCMLLLLGHDLINKA
jgi:hypothetical protein